MIQNELLKQSILQVCKQIPFARFTGRVSFEMYGVYHSTEHPHDIDIVVKSYNQLNFLPQKVTICESTQKSTVRPILEIDTEVKVDIIEDSSKDRAYKVCEIENVRFVVLHPVYASIYKMYYVCELLEKQYKGDILTSSQIKRLHKHKDHLFEFVRWSVKRNQLKNVESILSVVSNFDVRLTNYFYNEFEEIYETFKGVC